MSGIAAAAIATHLLLLLWLAPIAFFDNGSVARDWIGTLVPFTALAVPLVIAVTVRTKRGFTAAATSSLIVGAIFFVGPGILMTIPAALYAWAAARYPVDPPPTPSVGDVAYYTLCGLLLGLGLLGIASVGMFFLLPGVTLVALAPFRRRPLIFWPVILVEAAAILAYLYMAPFGCTATSVATTDGSMRSETYCTNVFGDER